MQFEQFARGLLLSSSIPWKWFVTISQDCSASTLCLSTGYGLYIGLLCSGGGDMVVSTIAKISTQFSWMVIQESVVSSITTISLSQREEKSRDELCAKFGRGVSHLIGPYWLVSFLIFRIVDEPGTGIDLDISISTRWAISIISSSSSLSSDDNGRSKTDFMFKSSILSSSSLDRYILSTLTCAAPWKSSGNSPAMYLLFISFFRNFDCSWKTKVQFCSSYGDRLG